MNGQKEVGEEMGEKNLIEKTWNIFKIPPLPSIVFGLILKEWGRSDMNPDFFASWCKRSTTEPALGHRRHEFVIKQTSSIIRFCW